MRRNDRVYKYVCVSPFILYTHLAGVSIVQNIHPIGKAMQYALSRWEQLSVYLEDTNLLIDNNQIENAVRPLAIGRKNYLFAGSHEAAQRAAMLYSFMGTCKKMR
jgi:hypothetical protein